MFCGLQEGTQIMKNSASPDNNDNHSIKVALTIAGSDSCGGAGIQADLKTFQALGVFGMSAVTAVTVQNTQKVYAVAEMTPQIVHDQISCLFDDVVIHAVKIGMVSSVAVIEAIADALAKVDRPPIVLDPVMISKSGYALLRSDARQALVNCLFPLAEVVTPNVLEAEVLIGDKITSEADMENAARLICRMGASCTVVKGGHLHGQKATDIMFDGLDCRRLTGERFSTTNTHGTGCTFSSAIAAHRAKGLPFFEAVSASKTYISGAIAHSLDIGKGHGPTHHFFELYRKAGMQ